MFACKPIRVDVQLLCDWLLKSELATSAIRVCCNHILAKEITPESNSRALVEGLLGHCVRIGARVVGFVTDREIQIVTKRDRPAVVFTVIHFPLHCGCQRGRVWSRLNIS